MNPSVVIVGAGALGLATAVHLLRAGATDVTVLEAAQPAGASSGLSVGMIQTQHLTDLNIELRAYSRRFLAELESESGLDIAHVGYLRLGFDPADREVYQRSVDIQTSYGITHSHVVNPDEIAQLVPGMKVSDVACGLWGPDDGYIDGHAYCGILLDEVRRRGGVVATNARLLSAESHDGVHILTTDRGVFRADRVVNAAGAWASHIADLLGVTVTVRPERHQALILRTPEPLPYEMPCVMTYSPGSGQDGIFVRHEGHGQLVAGMHSLDPVGEVVDPDNYQGSNDFNFLEDFAAQFETRFPMLADIEVTHGWAGIYPVSPDGLPVAGPHREDDTVFSAAAAGGAGIMLSPIIGRLVSDWIMKGESSLITRPADLLPSRPSLHGGN